MAALDRKGSIRFSDQELQEIDLRVPRKMSFRKNTEEILVENTRMEETKLSDVDLLLAATLLKDARAGRNMTFKTDENSIRAYVLYNHPAFQWTQIIAIWCLMLLAAFEKPAVKQIEAPFWATMIPEIIILFYFLFRYFHHLYFDNPSKFWRDPKNIIIFLIIILTFIDMMAYCIWISVAADGMNQAIRWSRLLRPLFLINFPEGRQLRKAFRNIRRTIPDISYVLILFLLSIALFALMALKLFQKRGFVYPDADQRPYFTDYFESYWDLYVLVTTANNPDVMMPSYEDNTWYSLFFVVYIIINLYIFMSIVLAVVYNNYKKHLKNEVRSTVYIKRRTLGRIFDMLKVWHAGRFVVPRDRWYQLMKVVSPSMSDVQIELLLYVLDSDGDNYVERPEFMKVADLLNVPLTEIKDRITFLELHCASFYNSKASQLLKFVVRHNFFRYTFDFLILVNAFFIAFSVEEVEWFFLAIFMLEIALKLYAYGPVKFSRSFWNIFDTVVIIAALVATIYETLMGLEEESKERTLDFILVLRVLRLVRLMNSLPQFQVTLTTIVNIGPSIITYGGVIFVIYYIYAILGMEIFHGLIKFEDSLQLCGNMKLNNSEFAAKHYCKNNFNDLMSSFILLFELMVVNQWHVLTQGFVLVTNKAARLFFISFHLITVVILLNIFTAFILEAFLLEYTLSRTQLEDALEKKIKDMGLTKGQNPVPKVVKSDNIVLVQDTDDVDNENVFSTSEASNGQAANGAPKSDSSSTEKANGSAKAVVAGFDMTTGLRFKLKKRRAKKIEVLLQHMFEGEIDPNDEGPENENLEGFQFQPPDRLTLDMVA